MNHAHGPSIGKLLVPGLRRWDEGLEYRFHAGRHELRLFYPHPQEADVVCVQKGSIRFGLYGEEGVIFLLAKFGELPWMDTIYSCWLAREDLRTDVMIDASQDKGVFMSIKMVDASTGLLKALRNVVLSVAFSRRLLERMQEQTEHEQSVTKINSVVARVSMKYSAEALVERCEITCVGERHLGLV